MGDDFLSLIRSAEQDAKNLVVQSQQRASRELETIKIRERLETDAFIINARKAAKQSIIDQQPHLKYLFRDIIETGTRNLQNFEASSKQKLDSAVSTSVRFFINDLL